MTKIKTCIVSDFTDWHQHARSLIIQNILPEHISWQDKKDAQNSLFDNPASPTPFKTNQTMTVTKEFLQLAQTIACHRDFKKWHLLYSALWRIHNGEKHLLKISTDPLIHRLLMMQKAIRRDIHKMKAFVRFRKTEFDGHETYVAWHRPDHLIIKPAAWFFKNRFSVMRWMILTPDASVYWDLKDLYFAEGTTVDQAPAEDKLEDAWLSYYRAIFNPARIKIKAMKNEMPVRHWKTLPETKIIPELLSSAPKRVEEMIAQQKKLAALDGN